MDHCDRPPACFGANPFSTEFRDPKALARISTLLAAVALPSWTMAGFSPFHRDARPLVAGRPTICRKSSPAPSPAAWPSMRPRGAYSALVGSVTVPGAAMAAMAARCKYAAGSSPRICAVSISE